MDLNQHLSEAEKADILRMHGEPKIYAKLVESLAPSVFGHLEVKRGTGLCAFQRRFLCCCCIVLFEHVAISLLLHIFCYPSFKKLNILPSTLLQACC